MVNTSTSSFWVRLTGATPVSAELSRMGASTVSAKKQRFNAAATGSRLMGERMIAAPHAMSTAR